MGHTHTLCLSRYLYISPIITSPYFWKVGVYLIVKARTAEDQIDLEV